MPQIPQATIDTVRDTSDILDVISQFVDLKQETLYLILIHNHD